MGFTNGFSRALSGEALSTNVNISAVVYPKITTIYIFFFGHTQQTHSSREFVFMVCKDTGVLRWQDGPSVFCLILG
ncbi:MAG: hypothetical protein CK532_00180 [Flavobacteriales bacterium]|nr:MAG: hypothetical protein CK532_00180 [Flavobacteriales bacterium]